MKSNNRQDIPRYYLIRIYLFSVMIYLMLILPVIMVLSLKVAPAIIEKRGGLLIRPGSDTIEILQKEINLDNAGKTLNIGRKRHGSYAQSDPISSDVHNNVSSGNSEQASPGKPMQAQKPSVFGLTFSLLFYLVIIFTPVFGLLINAPLKRFFSRKRKRKPVSERLLNYCKRLLLYTPYINSGILLLAMAVTHAVMFVKMLSADSFEDALSQNLFSQFFYVSLVASLLLVLFVFFWQKHRVQILYLEHVFSDEELYNRRKVFFNGKIQNRLLVSSAMTTLLPLTIVILYVILGLTPVKNLGPLSNEQAEIIVGPYKALITSARIDSAHQWDQMYYVNAIDNILMFTGIAMGILVALIYIVFFVRWTTASILRPVGELLANMRLTSGMQINNYSLVRSNDEIGELSEGYNYMTKRLVDYIDTISRMNEAYVRFVPRKFLQILGKDTFTDVRLGDQVQKEMTILFSDIRSFTELSEEMTPKENFDFINHYLGMMEPIIARHNGFIDKYIGDSIMALFGESVDDAVNAAIEMCNELRRFNEERKAIAKPAIDVGIGIHTGKLMLGVIGGKGRIDGTVISDAVNLASRIEGLTKIYGANIIVSEDSLFGLKDKAAYHVRFLDVAKVKGKRQTVHIFEVFHGDHEAVRVLKQESKEIFSEAVEYYMKNECDKAARLFGIVVENNPADKVARLYMERCIYYTAHGRQPEWQNSP